MQLKAQQRAKLQQNDPLATSRTDQSQARICDDVVIINNSIPRDGKQPERGSLSEEPNVGTLVTISTTTTNTENNNPVVKATCKSSPPVAVAQNTLQGAPPVSTATTITQVGSAPGNAVVARVDGDVAKETPPPGGVTVDGNSDSALPTTSSSATTKSSKNSASESVTEELETYSESYC